VTRLKKTIRKYLFIIIDWDSHPYNSSKTGSSQLCPGQHLGITKTGKNNYPNELMFHTFPGKTVKISEIPGTEKRPNYESYTYHNYWSGQSR